MKLIIRNKMKLQFILMENFLFVLQYVFNEKLLERFQYMTLKTCSQSDPFKAAIDLVDAMIGKGEATCMSFLSLLKDTKLTDVLPDLKTMPWYSHPTTSTDPTTTHIDDTQCPVQVINNANSATNPGRGTDAPTQKAGRELKGPYKMASVPRGYCLILENETFTDPVLEKRKGTEKDSLRLADVFSWLGFTVILCKDKTKAQMAQVLKFFARLQLALPNLNTPELLNLDLKQWSGTEFSDARQLHVHGDGFVCCILSHGEKEGPYGVDGQILSTSEIKSAFSNIECPALLEKPKVFFVQACRGELDQRRVVLKTDSRSLPEITDFLFAYATIDLYTSSRSECNGSWFIQTLCNELQNGCPRHDMNTILTRVNDAVCGKEGTVKNEGGVDVYFKQSTVFENMLRKLLIFHPPSSSSILHPPSSSSLKRRHSQCQLNGSALDAEAQGTNLGGAPNSVKKEKEDV